MLRLLQQRTLAASISARSRKAGASSVRCEAFRSFSHVLLFPSSQFEHKSMEKLELKRLMHSITTRFACHLDPKRAVKVHYASYESNHDRRRHRFLEESWRRIICSRRCFGRDSRTSSAYFDSATGPLMWSCINRKLIKPQWTLKLKTMEY